MQCASYDIKQKTLKLTKCFYRYQPESPQNGNIVFHYIFLAADLSRLIPTSYMKKGKGRVEKTEIIEMAIKHMKHLQTHACTQEGI